VKVCKLILEGFGSGALRRGFLQSFARLLPGIVDLAVERCLLGIMFFDDRDQLPAHIPDFLPRPVNLSAGTVLCSPHVR